MSLWEEFFFFNWLVANNKELTLFSYLALFMY